MTTAKLFMSGRSQALRLPAKLRLQAKEVRIEQMGDALWVQPVNEPINNMGAWLQHFYAENSPLPAYFIENRHDEAPQARDWS